MHRERTRFGFLTELTRRPRRPEKGRPSGPRILQLLAENGPTLERERVLAELVGERRQPCVQYLSCLVRRRRFVRHRRYRCKTCDTE
jgi:hypothetical protein